MKKSICSLILSVLFFYCYGSQPFYVLSLGAGNIEADKSVQNINFGLFSNSYVNNSSAEYSPLFLATAGFSFNLIDNAQLKSGFQLQYLGSINRAGQETVGLNLQKFNYQFKYQNTSLFWNNELDWPIAGKLNANFIGKLGVAHNRVYGWQASPVGSTAKVGNGFSANNSNQFAWGIGAGIGYQMNRINLSLDYLYTNLGSVKLGIQQNQLTSDTYSLNNMRSNQILLNIEYS